MLMNQLTLIGGLCFFIGTSTLLWIKWRKIGMPLLALLIALLLIFTVGIVKSSILGSMRLNSIAPVMNLDADLEFTSRGADVLGTLKSWNKILRGKKPIYTTSGGSQISMDSIGEEKSIKLFKRF
jgi:hypothetical protein